MSDLRERLIGIRVALGIEWTAEYRQQVFDTVTEAAQRVEAMQLTLDEVVAAIFAIENANTKARRDGDLVREDHKEAVRRVLSKLRDEYDRLSSQN